MEVRQRQPWRLGPRGERWFDLALVAVLLLPAPVWAIATDPWQALLGAGQVAPLLVRRRHSVVAFAAIAALSALQVLVTDEPLWSQLAFPVALYSVARFSTVIPAAVALAVSLVAAIVAAVDWLLGFGSDITAGTFSPYFVTIAAIVATAWSLGTLGRTRQAYVDALVERGERIARDATQQAALAAIEERHRIAREMHDVVAHGLTTIVVQADGARAASAHDPAVAEPAFATIAGAGREAIAEMRRMLGLLRSEDTALAPQPRLDDLHALVAEARADGLEVDDELPEALPTVSDGVALTGYRVVQEALTNVRKHAGPGARARVHLRVDPATTHLLVDVTDDGRGAAAPDDGRGLGLTGMQERVGAHGGDLAAGPVSGGGYRVCARIPL